MAAGGYPIRASWEAATRVCAACWAVDARLLRKRSTGRGPRPVLAAREPRKVAVYLTALLSGDNYAAIGRAAGLHKDTVSTHCAEGRAREGEDHAFAELVAGLERLARRGLEPTAGGGRRAHRRTEGAPEMVKPELSRVFFALASDEAPSSDERASSDTKCTTRQVSSRRVAA